MFFLHTAYADGSTFFLRDILSVKELINSFHQFYHFSGLKAITGKCEIAGIGSLKVVTEAVCGLKSVDLSNDIIKISGIHFSYNIKVRMQNNFITTIRKIQQVLRLWNSRTLTLEGRIMIFKTLAISKIVYLTLITNVPKVIAEELQKIQKNILWQNSRPKIKHKTLSNTFETRGLKNVDINLKVISLQCSWVKKLYDENFHEWKVIPLHLIRITFGQIFKFHSNLTYDAKLLTSFPVKNIFRYWNQHFTVSPDLPSCILSSFLWYNKDILISNKPIYFKHLSNNNLNYVTELFDETGNTKEWMKLKHEFNLNNNLYFKWTQLIHSIPRKWKNTIKNNRISENLL